MAALDASLKYQRRRASEIIQQPKWRRKSNAWRLGGVAIIRRLGGVMAAARRRHGG